MNNKKVKCTKNGESEAPLKSQAKTSNSSSSAPSSNLSSTSTLPASSAVIESNAKKRKLNETVNSQQNTTSNHVAVNGKNSCKNSLSGKKKL